MRNFKDAMQGKIAEERGASFVEWVLLVAMLAMMAIPAGRYLGGGINEKILQVGDEIGGSDGEGRGDEGGSRDD